MILHQAMLYSCRHFYRSTQIITTLLSDIYGITRRIGAPGTRQNNIERVDEVTGALQNTVDGREALWWKWLQARKPICHRDRIIRQVLYSWVHELE